MSQSTKEIKDEWELEFWMREKDKFDKYIGHYRTCMQEFGLDGGEYVNGKIGEIGTGPFSGFLTQFNASVKVSIDPMNNTYKDKGILREFEGIEYFSGEFEDYTGKDFDAIFCKNALDHGDMSFSTLGKIAESLKEGGYFYLMVNMRKEHELNACHDHSLTIEDFNKSCEENNLKIVKSDIWQVDKIHNDPYQTLCAVLQK